MIKGIGHIGIVVRNLEKSLAVASKSLGIPMPTITEVPEQQMRFAMIDLKGIALEFIQDDRKDGDLAAFVRAKGDGIHHFSFLTDNIEQDAQALKKRGVEFIYEKPKMGIRGKGFVFTTDDAMGGIPFELSEI